MSSTEEPRLTVVLAGPYVARNVSGRRSNITDEVAASAAHWANEVHRKRIEEVIVQVKIDVDRRCN